MKSPRELVAVLDRRLGVVWAAHAAGEPAPWNPRVPLGTATTSELEADFPAYAAWARQWAGWATQHGVDLDVRTRRVRTTNQALPVAVVIPDVATAARVAGGSWTDQLSRAAERAGVLRDHFPHLAATGELVPVVRTVTAWTGLDFELLCAAGLWFASNDATGMTPRQVPIPGMHAKWLNTRQHLVCALAGRRDLGLAEPHPSRAHFTYLDPSHRDAGGRWHDSQSVGDTFTPAYDPAVVLICENKDTVIAFPPVPGAVAIEGNGRGAGTIAALPWVRSAPAVVYWGDMDADGLEILAEFRTAGLNVTSLLMDPAAFAAWSRFGTWHDRKGQELTGKPARSLPGLVEGERALYEMLCDPSFTGPRRVEQERVPLAVARDALLQMLAGG